MLVIRSEQIRAFQKNADDAFVRRIVEYLRENHGDALVRYPQFSLPVIEIPDEILEENVRGGLFRADEYGISLKSTLISYVVLMFIAAPNFNSYQVAARFFRDTETIDDEAMENFLNSMTDEDWTAIEANYNASAWQMPVERGVFV